MRSSNKKVLISGGCLVIREKYIDLLPLTQLRRDVLKIINGYPDAKLKMENIKDYLIKYGYDDIKENILYTNLEFLEKNEFIAGIPLPSMGNRSRPPSFYRLIEEKIITCKIDTIIRCNDPMQCPDQDCRICSNAGIKTRWD
jgi:hypothetical protein